MGQYDLASFFKRKRRACRLHGGYIHTGGQRARGADHLEVKVTSIHVLFAPTYL